MTSARTISLALFGAITGLLAVSTACLGQTVASASSSSQQASLSVTPSEHDYAAGPTKAVDPINAAALHVLEVHCARCHESEQLVGRTKPAKGFGNILHLDEVAANPKYVKPGDPNHSPLYWMVFRKDMPSDLSDGDWKLATTPNDADLAALRNWIVSLAKKPAPEAVAIATQQPLPPSQIVTLQQPAGNPTAQPASGPSVQVARLPDAEETMPAGSSPVDRAAAQSLSTPLPANQSLVAKTQDRLKKLGCYQGEVNGVESPETDAALARYNAKLGRGTAVASLTSDLLEELMSQFGQICTPICPPGQIANGFECVPEPGMSPVRKGRPPVSVNREEDDEPREAPRHTRPKLVTPPAETAREAPRHKRTEPEPAPPHQQQRKVAHANEQRQHQSASRNEAPQRHEAQRREAPQRTASSSRESSSASTSVSGLNGM